MPPRNDGIGLIACENPRKPGDDLRTRLPMSKRECKERRISG